MGHHTYTRDALWSMALLGHGGNFFFFSNLCSLIYFYFILFFCKKIKITNNIMKKKNAYF